MFTPDANFSPQSGRALSPLNLEHFGPTGCSLCREHYLSSRAKPSLSDLLVYTPKELVYTRMESSVRQMAPLDDEPKYRNFLEHHLWWASFLTSILLLGGFEHRPSDCDGIAHVANLSASWLDAWNCPFLHRPIVTKALVQAFGEGSGNPWPSALHPWRMPHVSLGRKTCLRCKLNFYCGKESPRRDQENGKNQICRKESLIKVIV